MPKLFSILFGALFTCAVSWAMGRILLSRLRLKLYREEEHLLGFVAGSVLLGLAMFVLGTVQAFYDGVFLAVGAAVLLYAWRTGALRGAKQTLPPWPKFWKRVFLAVYVPYALYAVVWALAPEHSPDGSSYHLGVMGKFYREHGFSPMPDHMYAQLSQGIDLLFLHAYAFGRHSAAALTHCIFLLALPLLMVCFGRRHSIPGPSVVAALLVFAAPVVAIDGASAYNDVAVAAILFAIFYIAETQREEPSSRVALLLGILAGGAFAAKYTAFVAFPYALLVLAAAVIGARRRLLKPLAVCTAAAAAFVLPWMIRNWIFYSNPVSPLFNAFFPNPSINISFEQDYTRFMRMYPGVDSYARLPYMLTVDGELIGGHLGPVFLMAPLALLAVFNPLGRRILLAALFFLLPYPMNIGTRFLIPALPLVTLAMCVAIPSRIAGPALVSIAAVHGALSLPPVIARSPSANSWHLPDLPWRAALRIEAPEEYLGRVSPEWRVAQMIERATPADAVVLALAQVAEAYTSRQIWVDYQSAKGELLRDRLYVAIDPNLQPVRQLRFEFPRQSLTAVRLVQTAPSGSRDIWGMAELRLYDGGREIPSSPSWKLRSSDAPWTLPLAFDGNPVTRWRAWRWLEPGMSVSVELPTAVDQTAVAFDAASDQYDAQFRLEGLTSGGWKELSKDPRIVGLAPPLGLRCMATRGLLKEGVTHIAIPESHPYGGDFAAKADLWGITEAGAESGMRLYRLEQACLTSFSVSTGDSPPQRP